MPIFINGGPNDPAQAARYRASYSHRVGLRYRHDCSYCPSAGFVWTSGFCLSNHWEKKPTATGPLDHNVWSKLPSELLHLVFARLPTDGIGRARSLSKHWNLALPSSSPVTKECGNLQPKLCALLGFTRATQECWVRAYDSRACT